MERGYPPSRWDDSSQPSNMAEALFNISGSQARREKLSQAYGRTLLSALQTSPPQTPSHSSSSFSERISAPTDAEPRSNPFPIEFGSNEPSASQNAPIREQSNIVPQIPGNSLHADAIQHMMLAALAMNPSLLLGQSPSGGPSIELNTLPLLGGTMKPLVPDGSGLSKYLAPNMASLVFDQKSGYKFDPTTGLHYDANTGLFINLERRIFLRWDTLLHTYVRVDLSHSLGQPSGVGFVAQNSSSIVPQLPISALTNALPCPRNANFTIPVGSASAQSTQIQAPNALIGGNQLPGTMDAGPVQASQESFLSEIWQRMRALAKEAIGEPSHTSENKESVKHHKSYKRLHKSPTTSSSSRSRSMSPEDKHIHRDKRRASMSPNKRSKYSKRRKDKKLSDESHSSSTRRGRSRVRKMSDSRSSSSSTGGRKSWSRGRSHSSKHRKSLSRSLSRQRSSRRSPNRGTRRSLSKGVCHSKDRRRRRTSGSRRSISRSPSRSRIVRKTSRGSRSYSRGPKRRFSRSPRHRRSGSRGAKRSHIRGGRSRSRSRQRSRGQRNQRTRIIKEVRRGRSRSRRTRSNSRGHGPIISKSPGSPDTNRAFKTTWRDKESNQWSPRRQHLTTIDGPLEDSKRKDCEVNELSDEKDDDSDILSDFDFLKETLNDDNESVVVDDYEETLENDESLFKNKADIVHDPGDCFGHLFADNWNNLSNIILVAPVPLQDHSQNATLKNQIIHQEGVLKVSLFDKMLSGTPYHYMLIFFKTIEDATQWYDSNNGAIIMKGVDGASVKGYLHFVETGNWNCSNCKSVNFMMRMLCHKCYQAKDNGFSPVSVAQVPTKWVGISKLKSCFSTTQSVLDSLPSLEYFNIQNVQIIPEPRGLPLGLCVFEVGSEAEGTKLHDFFRQHGRASIYVKLNEAPHDRNTAPETESSLKQKQVDSTTENDQLEDLFSRLFPCKTPKNIVMVAPIPLSNVSKKTKTELAFFESFLQSRLRARDTKYDRIAFQIDKAVGSPFSYGLIYFQDVETAADWRSKHNSLTIDTTGLEIAAFGCVRKVYLNFSDDNWSCHNCLHENFPFRSLCHQCFIHRDKNISSPISKSTATTRWVATSRLPKWFAGDECIVADFKNLMQDLKLTKIDVLRDPKFPAFPLVCVMETESWGESLRLREFLHRTGRFSHFVNISKYFSEFAHNDITPKISIDSYESALAINSNQSCETEEKQVSNNKHLDDQQDSNGTGLKMGLTVGDPPSVADVNELLPDLNHNKYLLWWDPEAIKYSDVLNNLFLHNPDTRSFPCPTIFVGPLTVYTMSNKSHLSTLQKLIVDQLEKDGFQFTNISTYSALGYGAPCAYALVNFTKLQDAEAWQAMHRDGLILPVLPKKGENERLLGSTSKNNEFFKVYLYFCKPNWLCHHCCKTNFGLRLHCATCLKPKEQILPVVTRSRLPTLYVCISKYPNWAINGEILYQSYPSLKDPKEFSQIKFLKEESGIPLGVCVLEAKNIDAAQKLYSEICERACRSKKKPWYGILNCNTMDRSNAFVVDETEESLKSVVSHTTLDAVNVERKVLVCPDYETICWTTSYESRLNQIPNNIVMISSCPGDHELPDEARLQILNSLLEAGVNHKSILYCYKEDVGSPFSYCLISFDTVDSAVSWVEKCRGTFEFNVPCPEDELKPLNLQNCYLQRCSSKEGSISYVIKSKLHYSSPNWKCGCGTSNFPLRSLCYNCFKNKNNIESDYEIIVGASSFVGIKLTDHNLHDHPVNFDGIVNMLMNAGQKVSKCAVCFDPALPRDPKGVLIFDVNSSEYGKQLYELLTQNYDENIPGTKQWKALKSILAKSSGVSYFSCSKPLFPLSAHFRSENWESYFVDETPTNILIVDSEFMKEFRLIKGSKKKFSDPFRLFHGKLVKRKRLCGFLPSFWCFRFPTVEDSKKCYDASNEILSEHIKPGINAVHYTENLWVCGNCSAFNFPARVICHQCYRHKENLGMSPVSLSMKPTKFVGIFSGQHKAVTALTRDFRRKNEKFMLRSILVFFDPIVRQDGTTLLVFEVSSPEEGRQLLNFFQERRIPGCSFFELMDDSNINSVGKESVGLPELPASTGLSKPSANDDSGDGNSTLLHVLEEHDSDDSEHADPSVNTDVSPMENVCIESISVDQQRLD